MRLNVFPSCQRINCNEPYSVGVDVAGVVRDGYFQRVGGPLVDGNVGAVLELEGYTLGFAIPCPLRDSKSVLRSFTPVAGEFTIPDLSQVDQTAGQAYIPHIVELVDSNTFQLSCNPHDRKSAVTYQGVWVDAVWKALGGTMNNDRERRRLEQK